MSITKMTRYAALRRLPRHAAPPEDLEIHESLGAGAAPAPASVGAPAGARDVEETGDGDEQANRVAAALEIIMDYVPTEILTLYVAAVAAVSEMSPNPELQLFWFFLVATPLVVWLGLATRLRGAGAPLPLKPAAWPHWEMFAATVAFVTWALALPESAVRELLGWPSSLTGLAVLVVSTVLGLLAGVFGPRTAAAT